MSVSGSETLFNFLQFANVYFSIEVIPVGIEIEEKLPLAKEEPPRYIRFSGRVISVRPEQGSNALYPIEVRLFGKEIFEIL